MEVRIEAIYVVPLFVDDELNRSEQAEQALSQGRYTISQIPAESIKAALLNNVRVIYPD